MRSFYQDRLGTNIGKTQNGLPFFQGANGQDCAHSFNEQRACGVPVSVADKVSAAGGTAAAAAAPLLVLLLLV